MIRLPQRETMGAGHHRSGWPYVVAALRPLESPNGMLLDDYVEDTFRGARDQPHAVPWIGVFHHPPHYPNWCCRWDWLQTLFAKPAWHASRPHLKLGIALSQYLADWLAGELHVPCIALRHPTETPAVRFSEAAFRANPDKRILQIGWYLRNTEALSQLQPIPGFRKVCLRLGQAWIERQRALIRLRAEQADRRLFDDVQVLGRVPDDEYDRLLAQNAVFLELYDVSACNVVVECIVRGTPLVVNRHPALVEYLGRDYPLFYDHFHEAHALFTAERLIAAHRHLLRLDQAPLSGDFFRRQVAAAVAPLGGGPRPSSISTSPGSAPRA